MWSLNHASVMEPIYRLGTLGLSGLPWLAVPCVYGHTLMPKALRGEDTWKLHIWNFSGLCPLCFFPWLIPFVFFNCNIPYP